MIRFVSLVFFGFALWLVGIVDTDAQVPHVGRTGFAERIQARGKCRRIKIINNEVRISFLNQEDAEIFAEDLKNFINE